MYPNSTMFMPIELKIYAFSGKFNVYSKRVLLSWIKICREFKLQTQIFTQKFRSWLRFYSEFLRKKLAAGGSGSCSNYLGHILDVAIGGQFVPLFAKWGFSHAPCSNYRSILSSCSYYLEDFDYRSILVDSGTIVQCRNSKCNDMAIDAMYNLKNKRKMSYGKGWGWGWF